MRALCGWALGVVGLVAGAGACGAWGADAVTSVAAAAPVAAAPAALGRDERSANVRAGMALGARVMGSTHARGVVDVVVVVDSVEAYAWAVSQWTLDGFFPVLIDDGTLVARENIARFVRGFGPAEVWRVGAPKDFVWPKEAKERARVMGEISVGAKRASEKTAAGLAAVYGDAEMLGVVVTSANDPAWTAGLALAAAHDQQLVVVDEAVASPRDVGAQWTFAQAVGLQKAVLAGAMKQGDKSPWHVRLMADTGMTLALNTPMRTVVNEGELAKLRMPAALNAKAGEPLATTDVLSRGVGGAVFSAEPFCFVAQVPGSSAAAAYRAMSAVFVGPWARSAWVFDAYPAEKPFAAYDGRKAAGVLKERLGFEVNEVNKATERRLSDWRVMTRTALNAGLVLVNASGRPSTIDLDGALADAVDVPMVRVPAAAHVIHSFSAQNVENAWTIAGRFLSHGVYAYVGSVHEPYLGAFVPTPIVAERLGLGCVFASAARVDDLPAWRITMVGDALLTINTGTREKGVVGGRRLKMTGELEALLKANAAGGGESVNAALAAALKEKNVVRITGLLIELGRDADAVRLAAAAVRDGSAKFDGELAGRLVLAAQRVGDMEAMCALWEKAKAYAAEKRVEDVVDAVWQGLLPLRTKMSEGQLTILKESLRPAVLVRDAGELAGIIAAKEGGAGGRAAALGFLSGLRSRPEMADAGLRAKLEELIKSYSGR
ncbi:MAG: hypothetical protein IBJ18_11450 [Phycisphaerales bacterium]|nr:hypothetical protein [Phycisphaerales bacterium]